MVTFIILISILIFSVVLHEVAHGAVAHSLGDPTAKMMGRLTLNPLPHLDPIGSVLVPLLLLLPALFGFPTVIFGWAKPVPYNPYNLRNRRWGEVMVGLAGPATNLVLALIAGLVLRFAIVGNTAMPEGLLLVLVAVTFINLLLAIFNLVPIPPLDGSKLLFNLFPKISFQTRAFLEQNGFFLLLLFIFFGFRLILPIIFGLFALITGTDPSLLF